MPGSFDELLQTAAYEQNAEAALDKLSQAALALTHSRNAMIARMNDELGCLELTQGVGKEWEEAQGERLIVDLSNREGIVGYVAAMGATFVSGNVQKEPRYRKLFGNTLSEIAVPVRDRHGRIRAVLNVESDRENAYTDADLKTCEDIALLCAVVLERQEAQTREHALLEMAKALDQAWTEEQLIEGVLRVAGDVLRFQAFSLFLHDPMSDSFVLKGSIGPLKEMVGKIRYKKADGLTGWVAETGEPVLLAKPQFDPRWRGRHVEFPSEQIASFLAAPIVWRDKTIGVLRAIRRVSDNEFLDNRFTESDQTLLIAIADHVATVLQSIRNVQKMVTSERMVAWGELSAKSSHMMGNRLFALKGDVNELSFLLDNAVLDRDELKVCHDHIYIGVVRLEEILQDFRDFLTATQVDKEPIELDKFVRETATEFFPKRGNVSLRLELGLNGAVVDLDNRRFSRALNELIENALGYTEEGAILVRTRKAQTEDILRAELKKGGEYATIEVQDNGPGIEADRKNLIFQPFFTGRAKGMGLGLSIVKGIIDAHGGGIYEGGEPGKGAKFVMLLPLSERSKTEKS